MPKYQFRLKHLLLAFVPACLFLGWWFKPFVVEKPQIGGLTIQYRVRRGWNGALYHYGPMRMYYANGTVGAESVAYDVKVGDITPVFEGEGLRFWKDDGTSVSLEEWVEFVSLEYLMREENWIRKAKRSSQEQVL